MERILIKPGVYKKVNKRKSPDSSMKKRIKIAQEKIDLLRELRPTQKFQLYHDDDLRPRLRKSMLVRELENVGKNIICSTPHHTQDPNKNEFIRKNFSVLLSPITFSRLSTENRESGNEKKNQKNVQSKQVSDESSEIRSNNCKNVTLSENAQDQQKIRKSLRISRRSLSINSSKIDKSLQISRRSRSINTSKIDKSNIVNQNPKSSDASFNSHERSRVKKTGKSPARILAKSPQVPEVAVKRTRIPVRTASQEKTSESNNNLPVSEIQLPYQQHENKCVTPRKTAPESRSLSKNRSLSEKTVSEDIDEQPMGGCKDLSLKSPQKSSKQVDKVPSTLNLSYTRKHDDEDIIVISSSCSADFDGSNSKESVEKKCDIIKGKSDNPPDISAETSKDKLDRDSTEFVNKTPRRRNNETLSSRDQPSAICNKTAYIPIVVMAPSQCENPDVVQNKSRGSAVRCLQADKGESSEIVTRSALGLNKLGEPEILQNTVLQKSIGIQWSAKEILDSTLQNINADTPKNIDPNPLSYLVTEITHRKSILNGDVQSTESTGQNNKCVALPEVGKTNPLSNIFAQIPARESYRSQECQTSINRRTRGSGRKEKFIRLEDFRCLAPVAPVPIVEVPTPNRSNVISFGCGPNSDTNSSSGRGSNLCEAAFNYGEDNRHSGFQIFESLEEDNIVNDAINFSDSEYGEHFNLFNESNRPWRFSSDDVPELPPTFRRPKDYSCDNNDSSTFCSRNKTLLRPRGSTAGLFTEGLQRDPDTLIKTGRKKYSKKSLKVVEEPVNPLIQTVSSTTENSSLRASSSDNNGTLQDSALNKTGKKKYNKNNKIMDEPVHSFKPTVSSPTISRMRNNGSSLRASSSDNDCRSQKATRDPSNQQSETVGAKSPAKGRLASTKNGEYNERSPKLIEEPVHQAETLRDTTLNKTGKKKCNNKKPKIVIEPVNPLKPAVSSSTRSSLTASSSDNDCRSPKATGESNHRQSEAAGAKTPAKSTKNREYSEKPLEESIHQASESVSLLTADRTLVSEAAVMPSSENLSLEVASPQQSDNIPKRHAEESGVSNSVKRSRKDNKNVPIENDTLTSSENLILSISSADQQLLGIRPLSKVASNRAVESDPISADSVKPGKKVDKGQKSTSRLESNQEVPNMDSGTANQEYSSQPAVESDIDRTPLRRNKNIRRLSKSDIKKLSTRCNINERNILPATGGSRPQRNRNPVRYLSDIEIEESALLNFGKKGGLITSGRKKKSDNESVKKPRVTKPRTRKGKSKISNNNLDDIAENVQDELVVPESSQNPASNKSPKSLESNGDSIAGRKKKSAVHISDKRPRRERSQNKSNTTKTTTQATPEAGDPNEVVDMPGTSREEDRVPLEGALVENLPMSHERVSQPMENESMPPPKGNPINSTRKKRTNSNLTVDSGIETTNINKTNKNLRKLSNRNTRSTSKKAKSTYCSDANVEQGSQEFSLPDQPETYSFPNPVSTTEQSPTNSSTKDGTSKKVAKDGLEDVSISAQPKSGASRYLERSVMSEQTTDMAPIIDVVNNNEYISYTVDNKLYSLKFANRPPSDHDYKSYGNFEVTQTVKFKDNFSAGYIRIHPGDHKRQNVATKYSLMYFVTSGSARVQCHNKTSTVEQGWFFVIPVGTEYSIKNIDPQRELVMAYTKMKYF